MSLLIDPKNLPDEGLQLDGRLPESVMDLDADDFVQVRGPLAYQLHVFRDDDSLIITGKLSAAFELQCGRCAETFLTTISLDPYGQDLPIENDSPIDLTTVLREDILLALPNHPRCETSTVSPRECPAKDQFPASQEPLTDAGNQSDDGKVWEVLDQLNQPKRN